MSRQRKLDSWTSPQFSYLVDLEKWVDELPDPPKNKSWVIGAPQNISNSSDYRLWVCEIQVFGHPNR